MSEDRRLDRRAFLKGLSLAAGALTLERATALAQPVMGPLSVADYPLKIELGGPIVKLRRPERKFTVYFDLLVEMPQGQLVQVKQTVRIIRAITRRFRGKEDIIFIPITRRTADISKEIKDNQISFQGEEDVLIDFGYICNTLRRLNGLAFAVEVLIEARGITADRSQICSANQLVVQNFDVPQVCKFR